MWLLLVYSCYSDWIKGSDVPPPLVAKIGTEGPPCELYGIQRRLGFPNDHLD